MAGNAVSASGYMSSPGARSARGKPEQRCRERQADCASTHLPPAGTGNRISRRSFGVILVAPAGAGKRVTVGLLGRA